MSADLLVRGDSPERKTVIDEQITKATVNLRKRAMVSGRKAGIRNMLPVNFMVKLLRAHGGCLGRSRR